MIREYIDKALQKAHYELIHDEEPFYGEVKELQVCGQLERPWKSAAKTWPMSSTDGCWSDCHVPCRFPK